MAGHLLLPIVQEYIGSPASRNTRSKTAAKLLAHPARAPLYACRNEVQVSKVSQKPQQARSLASTSAPLALPLRATVGSLHPGRKTRLVGPYPSIHVPPRTKRTIRKPHHRIPQIHNRAPPLRPHPKPLALRIRLQRPSSPCALAPNLQSPQPIHQQRNTPKIRMRRRLDLRHLRIRPWRPAGQAHEIAGFLLEAVPGGYFGGGDSEACGEEGEDQEACGVRGAHVGV